MAPLSLTCCLPVGKLNAWMSGTIACGAFHALGWLLTWLTTIFPLCLNRLGLCSNAFRTVVCVTIFRCPSSWMVKRVPSTSNNCIFQQDSPLLRNKELLYRFFLSREECAGALRGPRSPPRATKHPNPLFALFSGPPPVDAEGALLVTIRHSPPASLQLPHLGEGKPWLPRPLCSSGLPCW